MSRKILKSEIKYNIDQVTGRIRILTRLLGRYFMNRSKRNQEIVYDAYDENWNKQVKKLDNLFNEGEHRIDKFDMPVTAKVWDIRLSHIDYIAEKIEKYDCKSVLEVGAGMGLNMVLLGTRFPDVEFTGLEPTHGGCEAAEKIIASPPEQFGVATPPKNVRIIQGSILDENVAGIVGKKFDLVFTLAVLEQLYNEIDVAFRNIFNLTDKYGIFIEEWLEANYRIRHYRDLVKWDYFRLSWTYLNKIKGIETVDRRIPSLQPSWLKYAQVCCRKV